MLTDGELMKERNRFNVAFFLYNKKIAPIFRCDFAFFLQIIQRLQKSFCRKG